jgi:hypothetical protein
MREIFWLAEWLLASQEELYFMELVDSSGYSVTRIRLVAVFEACTPARTVRVEDQPLRPI